MSAEENKASVLRLIEAANGGDDAVLDEIIAPDMQSVPLWPDPRMAPGSTETNGPAGMREGWAMLRAAMPDISVGVEAVAADGDLVMVCTRLQGTHTGAPFFGVPAKGTPLESVTFNTYRFADGKIVEDRWLWDRLGAFQQLGVIPDQDTLQRQTRGQ